MYWLGLPYDIFLQTWHLQWIWQHHFFLQHLKCVPYYWYRYLHALHIFLKRNSKQGDQILAAWPFAASVRAISDGYFPSPRVKLSAIFSYGISLRYRASISRKAAYVPASPWVKAYVYTALCYFQSVYVTRLERTWNPWNQGKHLVCFLNVFFPLDIKYITLLWRRFSGGFLLVIDPFPNCWIWLCAGVCVNLCLYWWQDKGEWMKELLLIVSFKDHYFACLLAR